MCYGFGWETKHGKLFRVAVFSCDEVRHIDERIVLFRSKSIDCAIEKWLKRHHIHVLIFVRE